MRYLRMLSNSIAAGSLATAYVLLVVMQLNPALPLDPARLGPLVTTVGLCYAVHFAVICYGLLVVRQLAARELFSPAWLSVGVQIWFGALTAAAGGGSGVNVVAIGGGSLEFMVGPTAEGRLTNFGRVLDSGAVMRLATIHPSSAEAVWAAAMTGKLPIKNGVRSAGIYHLATG